MNDKLIKRILKFRDDRDWKQFHTPENLAKSILIEAGELLEEFQWQSNEKNITNLKNELADVLIYCILMAEHYQFNINEIIQKKINDNETKYPVKLVKGKSKKYNEYK
jgi:NTP pyrophosphatase (non-canonical NTP hydrolase)